MKYRAVALIFSAAVIGGIGAANAMPTGPTPRILRQTGGNGNVIDVQYYWGGNRYCWYNYGWNGPGFYWCGYAWRRGYGWGGPHGWHRWHHRHHGRDWDRGWRHGRDWDRGDHHGWHGDRHWGDHGHDRGGHHHGH